MNLRLVVVGVLLVVAALAFYLFSGDPEPPPQVAAPPVRSDIDEILVAARDIPPGAVLSDLDFKWITFPIAALRPGMITRSSEPNVNQTLKGFYARVPHLEGEQIRREKLVKATGAGFISAVLASGMRAMSISIDPNGGSSSGGFIMPNDRVDVMRTLRSGEYVRAEIVLPDVRVIAIGKNIQDPQGPDRTLQGGTVTLEVSPQQARALAVAQQAGGLFMVLRSLQDAGREAPDDKNDRLTIIRHGTSVTFGK